MYLTLLIDSFTKSPLSEGIDVLGGVSSKLLARSAPRGVEPRPADRESCNEGYSETAAERAVTVREGESATQGFCAYVSLLHAAECTGTPTLSMRLRYRYIPPA